MSWLDRARSKPAAVGVALALLAAGMAWVVLPRRVELSVGVHEVSFERPRGFELVQDGESCLLRNGPVLVELLDLGAPSPDPAYSAPLDTWVRWATSWLETSPHRDVARSGDYELQGRSFRVVETWDSLTHGQRRRFAFAINGSSLLVLCTRGGEFAAAAAALDEVLGSLVFLGG